MGPDESRTMIRVLPATGAFALCFLPLDAAWLFTMGPRLYTPHLGHLLAPQPDLVAAALFYGLYVLGVAVLVLAGPGGPGRPLACAGRAALFGLVCYATYDLTNQATLRDWPWLVTAIDLAWGSTATALAALGARAWLLRGGRRAAH